MIRLSEISTLPPHDINKKWAEKETASMVHAIGEWQHKLYAEGKQSLLVILQGMDASGKDGTIKTVFTSCNPTGIDVYSFKKPTELEMAHDFLWRVHNKTPEKGNIMVFNRSHYEDILIQRVHNWITDDQAEKRMKAINAFEELLQFDAKTHIVKCYMHISRERQQEKLQERLDDATKNWKHNAGDWDENDHWDQYMKYYEYAINKSDVKWHVIPCDKRWYRNYCVAKVVLATLEKMNPDLPLIQNADD